MIGNICRKKGFTLTEILIIVVLIFLILGALYFAYSFNQKVYKEGENSAEVVQNGRVTLERLTREIRQAREIVSELPDSKDDAYGEIIFEDGHVSDPYYYIHYFRSSSEIKREVLGYYFSGDSEENLVSYDAVPPAGQTLEEKSIESSKTIGEWATGINFWGAEVINVEISFEKQGEKINLETKIFGRNL